MKPNINDFENDLLSFINNHPYTKGQKTRFAQTNNPEDEPIGEEDEDRRIYSANTPNGDYEQIQIIINYIS